MLYYLVTISKKEEEIYRDLLMVFFAAHLYDERKTEFSLFSKREIVLFKLRYRVEYLMKRIKKGLSLKCGMI